MVDGGKSERRVTSKDSLFHHHHPNFYDFFFRAIAPFTGIGGVPSDRLFFVCTQVKIAGSGEIGGFVPAFTEEKALSTLDVILENH